MSHSGVKRSVAVQQESRLSSFIIEKETVGDQDIQ